MWCSAPSARLPAEVAEYATHLWDNFVGLGVVLGVIGLLADARQRPSLHIGSALLLIGHLLFYLVYDVGDKALSCCRRISSGPSGWRSARRRWTG